MGRMKVLLLEDVINVGLAGEVHTVAAGYARNLLMPRKSAVPATKGILKQAEEIRQAGIRRRAQDKASAQAQAQVIERQKLLFTVNAGVTGRLYGSITTSDIADRLTELVGFEVDRRRITPSDSIRQLGLYTLELRLAPEVSGDFVVGVAREGEGWAEAETHAQAAAEKSAAQMPKGAAAAAEADEE